MQVWNNVLNLSQVPMSRFEQDKFIDYDKLTHNVKIVQDRLVNFFMLLDLNYVI